MEANTSWTPPPTTTTTTTTVNIVCGTIMLLLSVTGLVIYTLFIIIVFKRRKFYTSPFFMIAAWLGVADCATLLLIVGYATPCVILNRNVSRIAIYGGVINVAWFTSLPLILLLATNRYLCICHTEACKKIYTKQRSGYYCAGCLCFGLVYSAPTFFDCCPLYFEHSLMSWSWDVGKKGAVVLSYGELGMVAMVTVGIFVLNGLVIRTIQNARRSNRSLSRTNEHRRLARERKVFFQFFITNIWLVVFEIPFITMGYLDDPSHWLGYFVTLTYIINCSINGWVYLTLNKTIQRAVRDWLEDFHVCACPCLLRRRVEKCNHGDHSNHDDQSNISLSHVTINFGGVRTAMRHKVM